MTITESEIQALHEAYCKLTEQIGLPLRFDRQRMWYDWCMAGFTLDDLKTVIRYIKRGLNDRRRNQGALKFSNLIAQPDKFEEDFFEARRVLGIRKPRPTYIQVEQRIGDIRRQVEIPAPDSTVNVGALFQKIRKELPES